MSFLHFFFPFRKSGRKCNFGRHYYRSSWFNFQMNRKHRELQVQKTSLVARNRLNKTLLSALWCKLAFKDTELSVCIQEGHAALRMKSILRRYFAVLYVRTKVPRREQHNYANTPREDYTHIFLVTLRNERPPVAVSIAIYDMHRRIRRIRYLAWRPWEFSWCLRTRIRRRMSNETFLRERETLNRK